MTGCLYDALSSVTRAFIQTRRSWGTVTIRSFSSHEGARRCKAAEGVRLPLDPPPGDRWTGFITHGTRKPVVTSDRPPLATPEEGGDFGGRNPVVGIFSIRKQKMNICKTFWNPLENPWVFLETRRECRHVCRETPRRWPGHIRKRGSLDPSMSAQKKEYKADK